MYLSTDYGVSWNRLASAPSVALTAHVIDPQNPSTMYLGGSAFGDAGGVFKSTDGGETWAPARAGLDAAPGAAVFGLAIDPKNSSTVYAATGAGLFKSTDSAGTWTITGMRNSVQIVVIDPASPSTLYTVSTFFPRTGIQRSSDAGATWTPVINGLPTNQTLPVINGQLLLIGVLLADPVMPGLIYLGSTAGLYRSVNRGDSWTAMTSGLPSGPPNVLSLAIDPGNPAVLYAGSGSGGLYKSLDRGASWILTELAVPVVTVIAIDSTNPEHLYAGTIVNESDAFVAKIVE
jgi:photosystem II stability/assembly factor-like uncharacterized protein